MIETYKIINGKYDKTSAPHFSLGDGNYRTRGNDLRINTSRTRYDIRKHFFTNRVVNVWNSLPNYIVKSDTINQFKARLDKFWSNQEIVFNYKAEIEGTGSRSKSTVN